MRYVCLVTSLAVLTAASAMPRQVAAQTSLPSPWISQDIGGPAAAGNASLAQGVFTISGSGSDIWGTADQFQFVYRAVSGDVDIIARVDSMSPGDPWSKTGVMIRGGLSAGAPHAMAIVTGGNGMAFQRRAQQDGLSTHTAGPAGTAPRWVRLVRAGTTVTGYTRTDGGAWTTIGSADIPLGSTAYVGLAVTSHADGILTDSAVSQVSVASSSSSLSQPTPLVSRDIGGPAIPGSTTYNSGTYTITAAGIDIWDSSDQFRYAYQPITGDVDVVARIVSIANTDAWSKAGVMVRETLNADSRNTMVSITAGALNSFSRRIDQGGITQSTKTSGAAPGWVRLVRTGSQFQAFRSVDGRTWTLIGTDTVPMTNAVYAGIAVSSVDASRTTTAVVDNFSVTAAPGTVNQPPTVTLTQPTSGATYSTAASIPLTANASDPENRLSRVEFFSNNISIGTDTTAPYSMTWLPGTPGTYTMTAKAFDADGDSATSQMVTITVALANQPPTVSLTAPVNGAIFIAPATIPLAATALDPEGRMLRVELYAGTTLLKSDSRAPYSFTWSGVAAGTYDLRAVAYDADANSTSSAVSKVTVTGVLPPPRAVVFVASADHDTLVVSYRLDIFPGGSNPATATRVASSDLGKPTPDGNDEITVDRATFFSGLAPGTYVATVSAVGSSGEGRGEGVTFTR